jgi:hypothetical protein
MVKKVARFPKKSKRSQSLEGAGVIIKSCEVQVWCGKDRGVRYATWFPTETEVLYL